MLANKRPMWVMENFNIHYIIYMYDSTTQVGAHILIKLNEQTELRNFLNVKILT